MTSNDIITQEPGTQGSSPQDSRGGIVRPGAPARAGWLGLGMAFGAAWLVHGVTLGNLLYTHDGWNDVLLGESILAGDIVSHENLLRIIPTLSFALRALFGPVMWAWHLPNVLMHAVNAALVVALTRRLGGGAPAARLSGVLFAVAPLLAHPVEWIGGSYDLFATCGLLGAAVAAIDGRPIRVALFGLLAVASKETGATVPVVALCALFGAVGRPSWRQLLRSIGPLVLVTLVVLGLRAYQVTQIPHDALAGRAVEARPLAFLVSGPAGVGVAAAAPFVGLVNLRDPATAVPLGFVALGLLAVAIGVRRREWRPLLAQLAAGMVALLPVSLIAMDLPEMVENARYLYATAALVAPLVGLLCLANRARPRPWQWAVAGAFVLVAGYGGMDRVLQAARVTDAAEPVADAVLALEPGSSVVVFSGFYDEPTARFLMSNWLLRSRGIRARYVMRGTGLTFSRRAGVTHDAAQAYFGPEPSAFDPSTLATTGSAAPVLLLQDVGSRSVTPFQLLPRPTGSWTEIPGTWEALEPPDSNDDPITIRDGRTLVATRYLGPVASAELLPEARLTIPVGPLTGVELTVRVRSEARLRYATGYHERFLALFVADSVGGWTSPAAFSAEVAADGRGWIITFDLSADPAVDSSAALGLMPLNYPGEVTIERVRVRR